MNISTEEVAAVWPTLDERTQQAVYIKILEHRLAAKDQEVAMSRHQIELLEQAVKQPAALPVINEV